MEVKGLVLWENQYKETSKLLRVFTDKLGKITILAQGVMRKAENTAPLPSRLRKTATNCSRGKVFIIFVRGK